MKKLLMYDYLQARGGAEALSLELCNNITETDLLVSYIDLHNFPDVTIANGEIKSLGLPARHPVLQAIWGIRAFSNLKHDINQYHKVMFSGSYAPLAVANRNIGQNFMYCHTPPRFVYDLKQHYLAEIPVWQQPAFNALVNWFQPKFELAIERMDVIIANSENVRGRLQRFLQKDAVVVYPPIKTSEFQWQEDGDYYLSTARLEPYKRVDLIVKAFMQMPDKKLVVASGGSQLRELQNMAKESRNISFTGWTSAEKLKALIGRSLATIYIPMDEDFGMSPVESMAAGKPVFGVAEGGVKETVLEGYNGFLLPKNPTIQDLKTQLNNIDVSVLRKMKKDCIEFAKRFDSQVFINKMKGYFN